ncbi:hypothetical protein [Bartonella gliris]|uniref:hypothetical protein n=1 Tax=Bartonella gliris TaxID=3004109 RepID=UPI00295F1BB3|nr:hypothetical protein [Bartonella gliris]
MTSSFIALSALRVLSSMIFSTLMVMPILLLYYFFIKRARLYCRATRELKRVMKERDAVLEQSLEEK